jgi:hypothetical protein
MKRDVFICHASEDKDAIARPLAEELTRRGWQVWFDEFEIELGDSLRQKIDAGLAVSRFGVVILSKSFFKKDWPQRELDGLVARETSSGEKVILPIWHEVDAAYVAKYSPLLAGRLAAKSDRGVSAVADEIESVLKRRSSGGSTTTPPRALGPSSPATSAPTPLDELCRALLEALDAGRSIAVRELLNKERRQFEEEVLSALAAAAAEQPGPDIDPGQLKDLEHALTAAIERRLATLFPLIEHRSPEFEREARWIADFATREPPMKPGSYAEWTRAPRYTAWMLTWACGALACKERNFRAVAELWEAAPEDDGGRPLPAMKLLAAHRLGQVLQVARFGARLTLDFYGHLAFMLAGSELVRERYPELLRSRSGDLVAGALSSLGDFDILVCALASRDGMEVEQFWRSASIDTRLRATLVSESALQQLLADELFGVSAADVQASVERWLEEQRGPTRF